MLWFDKTTGECFTSGYLDGLFFSLARIDWNRYEVLGPLEEN